MEEYAKQFFQYLERRGASIHTVNAYRADVGRFLDFLKREGMNAPEKITETVLEIYLFSLEKKGLSTAALARCTAALKAFFRFLLKERVLSSNPAEGLRAPEIKGQALSVLTPEEADRLFQSLAGESPESLRDRAILELLYGTGLKTSELTALAVSGVSTEQGCLLCGGFGRERLLLLGEPAVCALRAYLDGGRERLRKGKKTETLFLNRMGEPFSRQGIWKLTRRYGESAGLEKPLTPEILRNSFASHMLQNGADPHTVSEMMGCREAALGRFLTSGQGGRLRDVYRRCHPRA